jgi:spore coat protein CotH
MSTNKHFDKICIIVTAIAVLLTIVFMNGRRLGIEPVNVSGGYEERLFDTSYVHEIDILMQDFDGMCEKADKAWYDCDAVIDGEKFSNISIRIKGNATEVQSLGSIKYSFRIGFDHRNSMESYHGLNKLDLNNSSGDCTFMKDYLVYEAMAGAGVPSPLCSYAFLTVNGKDVGLYLAVESVDDAFLMRNFGKNYGNLYKPECEETTYEKTLQSVGKDPQVDAGDVDIVGRTDENSGRDVTFDDPMEHIDPSVLSENDLDSISSDAESEASDAEAFANDESDSAPTDESEAGYVDTSEGSGEDNDSVSSGVQDAMVIVKPNDIKLIYIDDDPASYPNIFDHARQNVTGRDKSLLIRALKTLSTGTDVNTAVDADEVISYFAVHNFVVSWNSYTGETAGNYYLYEKRGRLSMLPWDYSSAFGTYRSADATRMVNYPIDTPLLKGLSGERPMFDWIMNDQRYVTAYHSAMRDLIDRYSGENDISFSLKRIETMLTPYIERDQNKLASETAFHKGVDTLVSFWKLRSESVDRQLGGEIPSTTSGQADSPEMLIDASHLELIDMK